MRMRRIMAFVLAVVMLMSNTVTASAASSSTVPNNTVEITENEDGTVTITPADDSGEEGSAEEQEGESEPSGEEGSSEESKEESSENIDETNSSESSEEERDSVENSSEEGASVSTEETSEEVTTEEMTTEELTTEEPTTEELLGPQTVVPNLTADVVDTTRDSGENVRIYDMEPSESTYYYFETIGAAVKWAKEQNVSDAAYAIDLCTDCETGNDVDFTVSDDDLYAPNTSIVLDLSQNIIIEAGNSGVARVNIPITGDYEDIDAHSITVSEGASLQIMERYDGSGYYFNYFVINFPENTSESNPEKLIIGEKNSSARDEDLVRLSDVQINNLANLEIYELAEYGGDVVNTLAVDSMTVSGAASNTSEKVDFTEVDLTTGTLELEGEIEVTNLTVLTEMEATDDSTLNIFGAASVANLTTTAVTDSDRSFNAIIWRWYDGGYADENITSEGSLHLSGKLSPATALCLGKGVMSTGDTGDDEYPGNDFALGDTAVTVTLSGTDTEADASLLDQYNYGIYVPDEEYWYLDQQATGKTNEYNLVLAKDYNDIRVYADTDEDDDIEWQRGFLTLADAKTYINSKNDANAEYYIHINVDSIEASGNDLNYADVPAENVALQMNGNPLTITADAAIVLDGIEGPEWNVDNSVGTLVLQKTEDNVPALTIEARSLDEQGNHWIGVNGVNIDANGGTINLGKSGNIATSNLNINGEISGSPTVHMYGRVSIEGADAWEIDKLYVHNLSEENNWQEAYIQNASVNELYVNEGNIAFKNAEISTLNMTAGKNLNVKSGGSVTIGDVVLTATEDIYEPARFEVERTIKLAAGDDFENPDFVGAKESIKTGLITINGNINYGSMECPIHVAKIKGWEKVEGDTTYWNAITEEFTNGEVVIKVENTGISTDIFSIEGNQRFLQRQTDAPENLIAQGAVLRVRFEGEGEADGREIRYTSFEDAVARLEEDFADSEGNYSYGRYIFNVLNNTKLTKNIVIPDCVQELIFETDTYGYYDEAADKWVDVEGTRYELFVDMNGKKLTTSAEVDLNGSVRFHNSSTTKGNIISTNEACALDIYEQGSLVDLEGQAVTAKAPVLDGVIVSTEYGQIYIWCHDELNNESDDCNNILNASFNTRCFCVEGGTWTIGSGYTVTALDFRVNGSNADVPEEELGEGETRVEASQLTVGKLTVKSTGEIHGVLDAENIIVSDENSWFDIWNEVQVDELSVKNRSSINVHGGKLEALTIILDNSDLYVHSKLDINMLAVKNASHVENNGELYADSMTMDKSKLLNKGDAYIGNLIVSKNVYAGDAMGDWTVQNESQMSVTNLSMEAGTFENTENGLVEAGSMTVKDINNNGQIIVNEFKNTGKLYLGGGSHLLVNSTGTLNNVNVGDRYGDDREVNVGRSSDATVTFTGTFTKNYEEQLLRGYVTDVYKDAVGNEYFDEGNDSYSHQWDWITIWDETADGGEGADANLILLSENAVLFKTTIKAFPVDVIHVLPDKIAGEDEQGAPTGSYYENMDTAVYQSGNDLKITGQYIHVKSIGASGEKELKSFSKWGDAVTYIDSLNSPNTGYAVDITKDLNVGTLTLPKKANMFVIRSGAGEETENGWVSEQVKLSFTNNITLNSNDNVFENLVLDADDVTVTATGKRLDFINVQLAEGTGLKAIKGNASTNINVQWGSDIAVKTKLSGINEIYMAYGGSLEVTGGLSVNNLVAVNWPDAPENLEPFSIKINGDLEVKTRLNMYSPTTVDCTGAMKLKDVYTNCGGNVLHTTNAGKISISGRVLAADDYMPNGSAWNKQPVIIVSETDETTGSKKLLGYRYPTEFDDVENMPADEKTEVMPFAITLSVDNKSAGKNTLATAALVSPIWFITDTDAAGCDFDFTHKEGNTIINGTNPNNAVVLSVLFDEDEFGNKTTEELNSFANLQAAFNEIDKIASQEMTYVITLNEDVEALDSKEKTADYSFPKKTAEVIIVSNNEEAKTITYKKNLSIKSNVTFENVILNAKTSGGTVALDKFVLCMGNNAAFNTTDAADKTIVYNVTGSGIGKGSRLAIYNCADVTITGSLNKVDSVALNNSYLSVDGKATFGTLVFGKGTNGFGSKSAISIADIDASESDGMNSIVTSPVLTWGKDSEGNEIITKTAPNIAISGEIFGNVQFALNNSKTGNMFDVNEYGLEALAQSSGISFAKAVNVNPNAIVLDGLVGNIYKKSGILVFKTTEPLVMLEYTNDIGEPAQVKCESFKEAVNEINALKTKRNYSINFIADNLSNPETLTMPNTKYVDTLTIIASNDARNIYYLNDIKFTSNVILTPANWVQVTACKDESGNTYYSPVDYQNGEKGICTAPVNITVDGAYELTVDGDVRFNTPVLFNGKNKAVLTLNGAASLNAYDQNGANNIGYGERYFVQGGITKFAKVNVSDASLCVTEYGTGEISAPVYKATDFSNTVVNASNANIIIGRAESDINKLAIKNLSLDGGTLRCYGASEFGNVTLSGYQPTLGVSGKKFNITGTLTSATQGALLETYIIATQYDSALNISGDVVLMDDENQIAVNVIDLSDFGINFTLGGQYDSDGEGTMKFFGNKLLTAKKADASAFTAAASCVGGAAEYSSENEHGYILDKSGNDIRVYYGDSVKAAVWNVYEGGYYSPDYFVSFADAVAAIEAKKDTDAAYAIQLLKDVGGDNGTKIVYEKVTLPSKAASVEIYSDNGSGIYYSNDLTLGCDTSFRNVKMAPGTSKKGIAGINVKGFDLTLDRIAMDENANLGKIVGDGKSANVDIYTAQDLFIAGEVSKIVDFTLHNVSDSETPEIWQAGKFAVTNLIYEGTANGKGVLLAPLDKGATVTNVYSESVDVSVNELCFHDMTITGDIEVLTPGSTISLINEKRRTPAEYNAAGDKLGIGTDSKIVAIKKADLSNVSFSSFAGLDENDNSIYEAIAHPQWADGAVYAVSDSAYDKNTVTVYGNGGLMKLADCVDYTQAVNYINNAANAQEDYVIDFSSDTQIDVNVTDAKAGGKSSITMPGKDKANSVTVKGNEQYGTEFSFAGNIATYGNVTLENLWLFNNNADTMTITHKSNSEGTPVLTLKNVTDVDGRASIKSITGEKNLTELNICMDNMNGTYPNSSNYGTISNMNYVSVVGSNTGVYSYDVQGMSNVNKVNLVNANLVTEGKAVFGQLILGADATWEVKAAATVDTIDASGQNAGSYISVDKQTVPYLTVNGEVSNSVKIAIVDDSEEIANYTNQPLVLAKTEAADKFVAGKGSSGEASFNGYGWTNGLSAYKDSKSYVYNGDIDSMEVVIGSRPKDSEDAHAITYAKTYADAITIINNAADANMDYILMLRKTDNNEGIIKTALDKNGNAVYGALALPKAGAANSLTIRSQIVGDAEARVVVAYTGTMKPACDLYLSDLVLTEGKVDKSGVYTANNTITPELGSVKVEFGTDVYTPDADDVAMSNVADDELAIYDLDNDEVYNLVFSKITSKAGTLNLNKNAAYVIGDAAVTTLVGDDTVSEYDTTTRLAVKGKVTVGNVELSNDSRVQLGSKNAINLTDIAGNGELAVKTSYTKDKNGNPAKEVTQLSIAGEKAVETALTVYQYVYDYVDDENVSVDTRVYQLVPSIRIQEYVLVRDDKPTATQKLITAPKLQLQNVNFVMGEPTDGLYLFKYDGVVYMTDDSYMTVEVVGSKDSAETYRSTYRTWEQAVKDIDKLAHTDWDYTIVLIEDVGAYNEPLKTLTLPTKAKTVTIIGDTDAYYDEDLGEYVEINDIEGIMTLATNISLKTDLDICVPIVSLKKSGNGYYSQAYTLNAGKYDLTLTEIPNGSYFDGMGDYESQIKLSGAAGGSITVMPGYDADNTWDDTNYTGMITQISKVGKVTLQMNPNAFYTVDENGEYLEGGPVIKHGYFDIKEGISGVTELIVEPGVTVSTKNKDVSVANLTIGESVAPVADENAEGNKVYNEEGQYVNTYVSNDHRSRIEAKNITVSNTLTMASAELKAGTSAVGDGKITLTNIVFEDNHNLIEGKQDKNAKSQIQIKGTVSTAGENIITRDSAATIGLCINNSSRKYAQLYEGMVLLTAPKAAPSFFWPCYSWGDDANMGNEPGADVTVFDDYGNPVVDENNPDVYKTEWVPTHGLIKSGNNIVYSRVREISERMDENGKLIFECADTIEARVFIGVDNGNAPVMEFATFEEAVKAIDAMGDAEQNYVIEILRDIEIGNEKQDGKFKALTLPAKAADVAIHGQGHVIVFAGNVTLKSNTIFDSVNLYPMKAVKGGAVPTKVNFAIGNFLMVWNNSSCDEWLNGFEDLSECRTCIGNITGKGNGSLHIVGNSRLKANNITGLNAIRFIGHGEELTLDDNNCGQILTDGNVTIKELYYQNSAEGILRVRGSLTTNVIYVLGECNAQIWNFNNKPIKINGATLEGNDGSKSNVSVVYVAEDIYSNIKVKTVATDGATVTPGTKIVTGKYLNAEDWELYSFITADNMEPMTEPRSAYVIGNDLYIGELFAGD